MRDLNFERRGDPSTGPNTVLLIHGIGSRWQMWEPVLDRLASERDVVAVDLPGFGLSPQLAPGVPAGPDGLTDAVLGFLAGLGVERPHVVGNSLGGWVALELAKRGAVRSATTFSPAGFARGAESLWSTNSVRLSHRAAQLMRPRVTQLAEHAWFRHAAYSQMCFRPGNVSVREVAESITALADAPGFDSTLRAIGRSGFRADGPLDVPVTIAWGEHDRLLLPRQAERAVAELPGARLVKLPKCGHIPTYDDPELVARVILEESAQS